MCKCTPEIRTPFCGRVPECTFPSVEGKPFVRTIAFDFDGVLHAYRDGYKDGTAYDIPNEGVKETLKYLLRDYAVYVFSTRSPEMIQDWFARHQLGFVTEIIPEDSTIRFWSTRNVIGISRLKLPAVAYIDDRAIRFTNMRDIRNYF